MAKDRNAFVAGLFIIVSFTLIVGVLILIHGQGMGPKRIYAATFKLTDDVGGLAVGDQVRLGGVAVGVVKDLQFSGLDGNEPRVLIHFSLPSGTTIHEDAIIRAQNGITGTSDLNIESVGTGKKLNDGEMLVGRPDPKSEFLAGLPKISDTVGAFKTTAESATTLVRHVNDKVDPVVDKYNGVAKNAGEAMAEARDLIGDSKTDFRGTIKNLNVTTGSIKDKLPGILDQFSALLTKVDTALTSAKSALDDIQKTVANTRDVSVTLREVVSGNHGKLDAIVTGLKATSDNLKATSIEVRRSPWRLLYKPSPDEMGNLNLYDSARQFAEGAASVSDAATALRDAMKDPQTDKAQLQKLIDRLDETFKGFHQVENKLWTAVKE
ncbi:MAG TPA: MlaD family protein [Humisphaera sp.]|jgi:ABC-type transporter Mla subunit MlaD|nr:MlaD family protein [Humisphaera sp.]